MNITNCNTGSLAVFEPNDDNPWDVAAAKHLYRRLENGATISTLNIAVSKPVSAAVDTIIDRAIAAPDSDSVPWSQWSYSDFSDYNEQNNTFRTDQYRAACGKIFKGGLKGRMAFFWLNHFVTQIETYNHIPYTYQYWDILLHHAVGNFKELTRAIGLTPAMLAFLNGYENTKQHPNENYARELYELFTLGENNGYTQQDIEETSRALTGYNTVAEYGAAVTFNPNTFDNSEKTIFGQTGNWDYNDVIEILFEQRASEIAHFICEKLYTFFVSPQISEEIIAGMAQTFIANDFEIAPVLRQLLKSEHFFSEAARATVIKSPFDLCCGFLNESAFTYDDSTFHVTDVIIYACNLIGQNIYQPPDVAGWQRDKTWINNNTIGGRWEFMQYLVWLCWEEDQDQFRQFAKDLSNNSRDTAVITKAIVDHFLAKPLWTDTDYASAESVLRWEVPQNYYDNNTWSLDWDSAPYQVVLLIFQIFRMPEFQLK